MVLDDLSSDSLERAVDFIAGAFRRLGRLVRARLAAEEHFSLDSGAARYDALFRDVLAD